ncbi:MAG: MotA/TolQ/ExbB proton channel family protein [Phycisphaeraceae bacterium]
MRLWTCAMSVTWLLPAGTLAADGEPGGAAVTFFEMFFLPGDPVGLIIVWLLLAMSGLSVALMVALAMQYRRTSLMPPRTYQRLRHLLGQQRYAEAIELTRKDDSYLAGLAGAALDEASNGYAAMERAVEEAGDAELSRYLRPVEYLSVLGNIAPMLGLFGTVYGMIRAFQKLQAIGGSPDPAELAGGLSTAMATTFWGLAVAIPALAAYALIRNRLDALTSEGMLQAEQLIRPFRPRGWGRSSEAEIEQAAGADTAPAER